MNTVDDFSKAMRFLKAAYAKDGGEGSGNFGHAGRPGKIGGSAPAEGASWTPHTKKVPASQEMVDLANKCRSKAKSVQPSVTPALKQMAAETGGTMKGLSFKYKGEGSLARKLRDKSAKKNLTPEDYSKQVTDVLRYTVAFGHKNFTGGVQKYLSKLKDAGYNVIEVENHMKKTNVPYRGINTLVKTPGGYTFELQFHTPQSHYVKEHKIHKAYEVMRDPKESPLRQKAAERYCTKYSNTIKMPLGVDKIADVVMKEKVDNG